jgi:hypothetical protein
LCILNFIVTKTNYSLTTGIEDHCRCFFCGGGLKHWDPDDKPWIEHARWYQHCDFVRQCRGDKFIEDVQLNRHSTSPEVN